MSSFRLCSVFFRLAKSDRELRVAFCWLCGLLFLVGNAAAAPSFRSGASYQMTNWRTEQSLPSNKIMCVAQGLDGYIWCGTYEGLVRFDGVKFTVYNGSNVPGWNDSSVTALCVAHDGVLWIGHSSGAISSYRAGKFTVSPPRAGWSGSKVVYLAEDEVGDIWIQDDVGHISRQRDGLVLTPEPGEALALYGMTSFLRKQLWVLSRGKLSRMNSGRLEVVPLDPRMDAYVHGICASSDGGVWALAAESLWKWKDGSWTLSPGVLQVGGTPVLSMIETKDGRLIGGSSDHGAVIVDPNARSGDSQLWRATGFPSDWVLAICEDHENGLWVATGTAGLIRIREKSVTNLIPPDEWQGRAVLSVSPARDGGFWVGTEGAGLYRLRNDTWTSYAKAAGIRNPYIWSVFEDAAGSLWLGTWGGSVYTRDGDQFRRAPGLEGFTSPVPALAPARDGGLWLGSTEGVIHYNDGKMNWVEPTPPRRVRDVRTVLEEPDGTLWVGSNGDGLARFRDGELRQFRRADGLPSDFIQCIFREPDGTLWIGTRGGGLSRLKDGRFSSVGEKNGLADGSICHVEDDGLGYYWMSSHGGILRVNKAELNRCADGQLDKISCLTYGLNDGLLTLSASDALQPSGCKTSDGKLVFATDRGLAVIDPRNVKLNTHVPPVAIESLRVGDRVVAETSFPNTPIEIGPGQSRIEFKYTGLSFAAPEKVVFKHRLEGLEPDWVSVGAERTAVYNYVPPGRYVFHVTAANNHNLWNEEGRSVAIVVLPYYWQTLWFKLLVVFVLLAATAALVWFQTQRRLQLKLERLERQRAIEAERTRIANDMHDDLGANLTRITMLSETARAEMGNPARVEAGLGQIYDTARNVTRAMDEIVWAVNPKHDTLESLVFYFERFAHDLLGPAGLRCRLDFPSEFPSWRPSSEVRHNLFLAYKEALNNAVRHSGADTVTVQLEFTETGCTLTVSDNGRGLANGSGAQKENGRVSFGNGLANMQERLARIGGTCLVRGDSGMGCVVSLFVPTAAVISSASAN